MYGFELRFFSNGSNVFTKKDECKAIYIVANGCLELYTYVEGNYMCIDLLQQGSILNYRVIFTDDCFHLNVKARGNTHLLELTLEKFEEIYKKDKVFNKRI